MTGLEEKIWVAVFARVFCDERAHKKMLRWEKEISGFHCAEIADEAVEKFREAITCDDAEYLLINQEK